MNIEIMQSVVRAKGLRISDDDPLFIVAQLAELAVNEANAAHLKQIEVAFEALQRFQVEMRSMGNAISSAADVLTTGRELFRLENDGIQEDLSVIKSSIAAMSREVSIDAAKDKERLNTVISEMNASLSQIAKQMKDPRSPIHARNESFLMQQIGQITGSIQQLKGIESALHSTATKSVSALLSPVLDQVEKLEKALSSKDGLMVGLVNDAAEAKKKIASRLTILSGIAGTGMITAFAAGYFVGTVFTG